MCNFLYCGSVTSFVYPICTVISHISKQELPNDDFVGVPIKVLPINGYIDPRSEEVGYMCLIGSNVSQS